MSERQCLHAHIKKVEETPAGVAEFWRCADCKTHFVADEPYVDEKGTAWIRPTAWAHAKACKALNLKNDEIRLLKERSAAARGVTAKQKEGWGKIYNAPKWHYFKPDGRSLCGRWLALGDPMWDKNNDPTVKGPDTCMACHTKLLKLETKGGR